jgi:anti-anti-sigma regulatory factor
VNSKATSPGADVIVLDGPFDEATARRLEEALLHVRPGAGVRVDLSRVRELHDEALARLALALIRRAGAVRVALVGLRRHQRRLLRYLGVEADAGAGGWAADAG